MPNSVLQKNKQHKDLEYFEKNFPKLYAKYLLFINGERPAESEQSHEPLRKLKVELSGQTLSILKNQNIMMQKNRRINNDW